MVFVLVAMAVNCFLYSTEGDLNSALTDRRAVLNQTAYVALASLCQAPTPPLRQCRRAS
jgi:hypothetical protein